MTLFILVGSAIAAVFLWTALVFNSLVRLRNRAAAAWSQIDVQLKRRHDLIPNLVTTAERYLRHERETLEGVARARAGAMAAGDDVATRGAAELQLSRRLGSLLMLTEGYPDLKGSTTMRDLMEQLTTTENRIAFARQYYNDLVMRLNTRIATFPQRLVAERFSFAPREFFAFEGIEGDENRARTVIGAGFFQR